MYNSRHTAAAQCTSRGRHLHRLLALHRAYEICGFCQQNIDFLVVVANALAGVTLRWPGPSGGVPFDEAQSAVN